MVRNDWGPSRLRQLRMAGGLGIHRPPRGVSQGVRVAEFGGPRGDASADVAANRQHVAEALGNAERQVGSH